MAIKVDLGAKCDARLFIFVCFVGVWPCALRMQSISGVTQKGIFFTVLCFVQTSRQIFFSLYV